MMKTEKTLVNVNKGQDAYSVIGNYISNHITALEDMIAVIQIDGCITNELYMVDMEADGYFYWKSDWWEGEEDVALIDFFPVSEAERPQKWIPVKEKKPKKDGSYLVSGKWASGKEAVGECEYSRHDGYFKTSWNFDVLAWKPLPGPYKAESEE